MGFFFSDGFFFSCSENEALWREVASLRQKHAQQQKVVNKVNPGLPDGGIGTLVCAVLEGPGWALAGWVGRSGINSVEE